MGRALVEMMRGARPRPEPTPSAEERRALLKLRQEAARAGAVLRRRGRGGLPASLVLAVMRRDGYRCKVKREGDGFSKKEGAFEPVGRSRVQGGQDTFPRCWPSHPHSG